MADRKITDLTALAAGSQATGDFLTIVDVSEAAAVDKNKKITVESLFKGIPSSVGIGTASPSANLEIFASVNPQLRVNSTSHGYLDLSNYSNGAGVMTSVAHPLRLGTANTERMRIDSSGRLLVGTSSSRSVAGLGTPLVQFEGNDSVNNTALVLTSNQNSAFGSVVALSKSRGTSVGSNTVVQNGDELGGIRFAGADGTDVQSIGAQIKAEVDGTPGSNDMPGRLVFSTTADGASSPTERLRIDSSGNLLIGTSVSNTNYRLTINDPGDSFIAIRSDAAADATSQALDFGVGTGNRSSTNLTAVIQSTIHSQSGGTLKSDLSFFTNAGNSITERLKIDSSGNVGVGVSSPLRSLHIAGAGDTGLMLQTTNAVDNNEIWEIQVAGNASNHADLIFRSRTNAGTGGSEAMRIDSSGRLLVGTSSLIDSSTASNFQIANASGPRLAIGRNDTSVTDGNLLGAIDFYGNDSNGTYQQCARILAEADGTHGTGDKPSRLAFYTTADGASSATERMRITNSGNVIIKDSTGADNITLRHDGTNGSIENYGGEFLLYAQGSQNMIFHTNGTERMRISSNGKINIGTNYTASSAVAVKGVWGQGIAGGMEFDHSNAITSGRADVIYFRHQGTTVGEIDIDNNDTAYRTTSDYRLKENNVSISNGIERVKQLNPYRFNWISTPAKTVDGFFAHEVQTVVPEAVAGTHNEVDDDGNPVYQGIDQSKLVPLLTAALQEAITKIETLETKVAALEAG